MDFITPYNLPIASPVPPKKDLISQIDAAKDADEHDPAADMVLKCNEVWYVQLAFDLACNFTNNPTGRKYRTAPRQRSASLTWTVFARTCRRRPNATAPVPWSVRRTSSTPSRSTYARRNSRQPSSTRTLRRRKNRHRLRFVALVLVPLDALYNKWGYS